jgi:DNA-binding NarL/FixJ family response regulator
MTKLNKPPQQLDALERFLSKQPEYVRADLEGNHDAANDRIVELLQRGDADSVRREFAKLLRARAAYQELLPRFPEKLLAYRERRKREGAKAALVGIPTNPKGARRKDERRKEITRLRQMGLTWAQIGQKLGISAESARKLVRRTPRKRN